MDPASSAPDVDDAQPDILIDLSKNLQNAFAGLRGEPFYGKLSMLTSEFDDFMNFVNRTRMENVEIEDPIIDRKIKELQLINQEATKIVNNYKQFQKEATSLNEDIKIRRKQLKRVKRSCVRTNVRFNPDLPQSKIPVRLPTIPEERMIPLPPPKPYSSTPRRFRQRRNSVLARNREHLTLNMVPFDELQCPSEETMANMEVANFFNDVDWFEVLAKIRSFNLGL